MAVSLDLKPLTDETIAQMGFNNHDLWLVHIDATIYGPYETESLKHYVSENENLFDKATATRMDKEDFQPFWSHAVFQRRKIQPVSGEKHEGPFWILDFGLKVGPISHKDIDKKIEMGLLVMTDHISTDDGQTWKKIFEIEGFDRRGYSPDELPVVPIESSFQKAKLALVEKMEEARFHPSDELANMCFTGQQQAKVIQFKVDEMTLNHQKNTEVSSSLKWVIPTAMAVAIAFVTTGYFMFQEPEGDLIVDAGPSSFYKPKKIAAKPVPPRAVMPTPTPAPAPARRMPASVGYGQAPQQNYQPVQNRYPTYTETHDNFRDDRQMDRDPLDAPVTDVEQQPEEHSLVHQNPEQVEPATLDAAMNGGADPNQVMIEEVSDF
jgi:hypothetical protein